MIPIICIEGATASGKSQLALELACYFDTEIISADSRQVYRYMDIGTAKVSPETRKQVKHHLIDIINPDQSYNAGAFSKDAAAIITSLHEKGKIPVVCGGTGLYIRSLTQGLFELPDLPTALRQELRNRLDSEGLPSLYKQLTELDPSYAATISSNDTQRILRGLEVALGTGMPLSEHWRLQKRNNPYRVFKILLEPPREELYKRINKRLLQMLSEGLVEEIRGLLQMGYTELSPGLNSLGYKEFMPLFKGTASEAECADLAAQHHRNYAKRQSTWYRKCTFDLTMGETEVKLSLIVNSIKDKLSGETNANHS
jgi:tRNA dimethylallyltransferase